MYQRQVTFGEAVNRALTVNYCNFNGRASRSEFGWFYLFGFIASCIISVAFCWSSTIEYIVSGIFSLFMLLPVSASRPAVFTTQAARDGGFSSTSCPSSAGLSMSTSQFRTVSQSPTLTAPCLISSTDKDKQICMIQRAFDIYCQTPSSFSPDFS